MLKLGHLNKPIQCLAGKKNHIHNTQPRQNPNTAAVCTDLLSVCVTLCTHDLEKEALPQIPCLLFRLLPLGSSCQSQAAHECCPPLSAASAYTASQQHRCCAMAAACLARYLVLLLLLSMLHLSKIVHDKDTHCKPARSLGSCQVRLPFCLDLSEGRALSLVVGSPGFVEGGNNLCCIATDRHVQRFPLQPLTCFPGQLAVLPLKLNHSGCFGALPGDFHRDAISPCSLLGVPQTPAYSISCMSKCGQEQDAHSGTQCNSLVRLLYSRDLQVL